MAKLEVKKIDRSAFSWGLWDVEKEEFIECFETKKAATDRLTIIKKQAEQAEE